MASDIRINYESVLEYFRETLPFISTVWISAWGGAVSHVQKLRTSKKKFNWKELAMDIVISSFAGYLTHLICVWAKMDSSISSVLIAVSGHMGARALAKYEKFAEEKLGLSNDQQPQP